MMLTKLPRHQKSHKSLGYIPAELMVKVYEDLPSVLLAQVDGLTSTKALEQFY